MFHGSTVELTVSINESISQHGHWIILACFASATLIWITWLFLWESWPFSNLALQSAAEWISWQSEVLGRMRIHDELWSWRLQEVIPCHFFLSKISNSSDWSVWIHKTRVLARTLLLVSVKLGFEADFT